ncbi:MAG TPA: RHS repeat-associated core domain-containing protein [Nitrososphaerales archaeon]|nr:RHS repeat-associated core domain-containing protein [Nitrososphaerales archaeon]
MATTSTGEIEFSSDYLPLGPEYNPSGSGIYYLFTGKLINPITGLYYFGARYFDQESGRFISDHTGMGRFQDPQSANRYVYASDNPLMYIDPSGRMITWSGNPHPVPDPNPLIVTGPGGGGGGGSSTSSGSSSSSSGPGSSVPKIDPCSFSTAGCNDQQSSTLWPNSLSSMISSWNLLIFLLRLIGTCCKASL